MRNWNSWRVPYLIVLNKLYLTYEELKRLMIAVPSGVGRNVLYLTYEELKRLHCSLMVLSCGSGLYLTYEELKLICKFHPSFLFHVVSYLWGIETAAPTAVSIVCLCSSRKLYLTYEELKRYETNRTSGGIGNQLYLTYEELKLYPMRLYIHHQMMVVSYLWGIETMWCNPGNPCTPERCILPMRNWNSIHIVLIVSIHSVVSYLWGIET